MVDTFQFISLLVMAFGVYMIYACVQLKVSGNPTRGVMVSGKFNLKNAKDLPGFIKYVYPRTLFSGIAIFLLALASLFCDLYQVNVLSNFFIMLILLGFCIYYSKMSTYAQQTYLLGLDVAKLKENREKMKAEKKASKKH